MTGKGLYLDDHAVIAQRLIDLEDQIRRLELRLERESADIWEYARVLRQAQRTQ